MKSEDSMPRFRPLVLGLIILACSTAGSSAQDRTIPTRPPLTNLSATVIRAQTTHLVVSNRILVPTTNALGGASRVNTATRTPPNPGSPLSPSALPASAPPQSPPAVSPTGAPSNYKPPTPMEEGILAFDSVDKEYFAKPGELSIPLVFSVTNISGREITINQLRPTCGCTLAKMPAQPWKMAPQDHGEIHLAVDLRGKRGTLGKSVFVDSSEGYKSIYFRVIIPDRPGAMPLAERDRNFQIAAANRQAVFKSDCAKCHVEPARGKKGHELYVAACGVCHDSEDRAPMVPDLAALQKPTDRAYWKRAVSSGIPGTLMPAFARDEGGPLTPEQVDSLVDYLEKAYPSKAAATPAEKKLPSKLSE